MCKCITTVLASQWYQGLTLPRAMVGLTKEMPSTIGRGKPLLAYSETETNHASNASQGF